MNAASSDQFADRSGASGGSGHALHPVKFTWSFVKFAVGRWWRLAIPCGILLALCGSAIVYFVVGPAYEAEAWLRIEDLKPSLAFSNPDSPRFINTQVELVRS